jgi:hypothetical protein
MFGSKGGGGGYGIYISLEEITVTLPLLYAYYTNTAI